jgi:BirA family biotin operon repressor/biotin-[acetyl-CoA-carboxylase] ligase
MRINILKQLETAWAGKTCLCFDVLDSTQTYGKELALREDVHGTLIVADTQSAGKGRRGRIWQSPKGSTISMSLCLEPKICPEHAAGLTLVMAMAVAEGIFELTEMDCQIKWPNDIVLNGKKICGILTELIFKEAGYAVIIGTGINVSTETFPDEIKEIASSLKLETGKDLPREALIASVLKHFEHYYEIYTQTEDLSALKETYEKRLANKDREVRVLDPKEPYEGVARGINAEGNLMVERADGSRCFVDSGEVSVRGLYGYV